MNYNQHKTPKDDIRRARNLRRAMTIPERILWNKLRELPPELNLTFRRQHPVSPYILDFACIKIKLAIKLDSESHDARQEHDHRRDQFLRDQGFLTLRFSNNELMTNAESVIETIIHEALNRKRVACE